MPVILRSFQSDTLPEELDGLVNTYSMRGPRCSSVGWCFSITSRAILSTSGALLYSAISSPFFRPA